MLKIKMIQKKLCLALTAAILTISCVSTAFAKEERIKISNITLQVESNIVTGSDESSLYIWSENEHYNVTDVRMIDEPDEWQYGDIPKAEIVVQAEDDFYFADLTKEKVHFKGSKATYTSSSRSDNNSVVTVKIKLPKVEGSLVIDSIWWDENPDFPIGKWDMDYKSDHYEVRLYRGGSLITDSILVNGMSYNFTPNITRAGEYSFKVRSVSSNGSKSDWYESDGVYNIDNETAKRYAEGNYTNGNQSNITMVNDIPKNQVLPAAPVKGWNQNEKGWWYQNDDKSWPYNGWMQIGGKWYCFDENGYMCTGWVKMPNGTYYYCDKNTGEILTSTYTPDGYYVDAAGVWKQ